MTNARCVSLALLLGGLAVLGCGSGSSSAVPRAPAGEWKTIAAADLTEAQRQQKEKAVAARDAMFTRLVTRLGQAVGQGGPAGSVAICQKEAPAIAAQTAREHGVAIGRTSFKLRNTANAPPDWARALVPDKPAEPVFLAGPDGWLGVFLPIRLQPLCLNCHGPDESIAPETRQALARYYPQDQATGFKEGDLRGWFWVEVGPVAK